MSLCAMVGIGAAAAGAIVLGLLIDQIGYATTISWVGGVGLIFVGVYDLRIW